MQLQNTEVGVPGGDYYTTVHLLARAKKDHIVPSEHITNPRNFTGFYRGDIITHFDPNFKGEESSGEFAGEKITFPKCKVEMVDLASIQALKKYISLEKCTYTKKAWHNGRQHILAIQGSVEAEPSVYLNFESSQERDAFCEVLDKWQQWLKDDMTRKEGAQRLFRIAPELSDLIVYCRTRNFPSPSEFNKVDCKEMCSLVEKKAESMCGPSNVRQMLDFTKDHLVRVYPNGMRYLSSNYDPMFVWLAGCQMAAINYQTGDKGRQINDGFFLDNGSCGYVLKPEFMNNPNFQPFESSYLHLNIVPVRVWIQILAARLLPKSGKSSPSPRVEVEMLTCPNDGSVQTKFSTKSVVDNGFDPFWNETFYFVVRNPQLSLLRFCVVDQTFGEDRLIGQMTLPLKCVRPGIVARFSKYFIFFYVNLN